jgi:hypothetical protein
LPLIDHEIVLHVVFGTTVLDVLYEFCHLNDELQLLWLNKKRKNEGFFPIREVEGKKQLLLFFSSKNKIKQQKKNATAK